MDGYHVIAEGLNGRTTTWNEPLRPWRNGSEALLPILESYAPTSLLISKLGTNDLKHHLNGSAHEVSAHESARGLSTLIKVAQKSEAGIAQHCGGGGRSACVRRAAIRGEHHRGHGPRRRPSCPPFAAKASARAWIPELMRSSATSLKRLEQELADAQTPEGL